MIKEERVVHGISTLNGKVAGNKSLTSLPKNRRVIVNQIDRVSNELSGAINCYEKGLSKSRNRALMEAQANFLHFCDDDILIKEDAEDKILNAFNRFPDADIITFCIDDSQRKYESLAKKHNFISILRVSSIEIVIKVESIKKAKILFDERFGLGANYPTGEENLFLKEALDKGCSIYYVPEVICTHPEISSGYNLKSRDLQKAKGALFSKYFGHYFCIPFMIYFCLFKYLLKGMGAKVSVGAFKELLSGRKEFYKKKNRI